MPKNIPDPSTVHQMTLLIETRYQSKEIILLKAFMIFYLTLLHVSIPNRTGVLVSDNTIKV